MINLNDLLLQGENLKSLLTEVQPIKLRGIRLTFRSQFDINFQVLYRGRFSESWEKTSHTGPFLIAADDGSKYFHLVGRSVDLFGKRVESFVPVLMVVVLVFATESRAFADRGS